MIEVLVAATILVVIVMMLGMLFQQTGIAMAHRCATCRSIQPSAFAYRLYPA